MRAMNTTAQLLALHVDPERHNEQTDRRTDDIMMPIHQCDLLKAVKVA